MTGPVLSYAPVAAVMDEAGLDPAAVKSVLWEPGKVTLVVMLRNEAGRFYVDPDSDPEHPTPAQYTVTFPMGYTP
jgi:hypothetical protein